MHVIQLTIYIFQDSFSRAPGATPFTANLPRSLPTPYATKQGQSGHSEAYKARDVPENYPRSHASG